MTATNTTRLTTTLTDPAEIVTEFIARLHARDLSALDLVHDDLLYVNVPLVWSRTRRAAIWGLRAAWAVPITWELRVNHMATHGDLVMTERTDILRVGPLEFSIWAIGHHEVRDGKIAVWRDYLDYADAAVAVPRGIVRSLLGRRV